MFTWGPTRVTAARSCVHHEHGHANVNSPTFLRVAFWSGPVQWQYHVLRKIMVRKFILHPVSVLDGHHSPPHAVLETFPSTQN